MRQKSHNYILSCAGVLASVLLLGCNNGYEFPRVEKAELIGRWMLAEVPPGVMDATTRSATLPILDLKDNGQFLVTDFPLSNGLGEYTNITEGGTWSVVNGIGGVRSQVLLVFQESNAGDHTAVVQKSGRLRLRYTIDVNVPQRVYYDRIPESPAEGLRYE